MAIIAEKSKILANFLWKIQKQEDGKEIDLQKVKNK